MIKGKMVAYTKRVEQLKHLKAHGSVVPSPIKFGVEKGEKYKPPPVKKRDKKEKKTWKKF